MNSQIKTLPHVPTEPLRIEREFESGREIIVIEGARYDADYFRTFAYPDTEHLYAVRRVDDCVVLTVIRTPEEAVQFFKENMEVDNAL